MRAGHRSTSCSVAALALLWAFIPGLALAQRYPAPSAQALQAQGLQEHSLQVGGLTRWFLVQPPPDASKPAPVLMIANGTLDPLMQWQGGQIAGGRGETRSVADTVQWWVQANKAGPTATDPTTLPDRDPQDACTIERRAYTAQPGGAPVVAYTLRGGGHNLPSARYPLQDSWIVRRFIGPVCRDVEGPDLVWDFLSAQRRP